MVGHELGIERSGKPSQLRKFSLAAWRFDADSRSTRLLIAMQQIYYKESPIHGMGAFAGADLAQGAPVIEYVGEKIDKRESLRRCESNNEYIFSLDDLFDLDGDVGWNPAKFINHSCSPNCDAELTDGRIWISSNCLIRAGEEITFNYGYDWEDIKDHPCHCGSPDCVGYMVAEEFFKRLRGQS